MRLINHNSDQSHDKITNNVHNLYEYKANKDAAERWEELSHPNSYSSCIDTSQPIPPPTCPIPPVTDINLNVKTAAPRGFDFETVVNKEREARNHATLENYHKVSLKEMCTDRVGYCCFQ